MSVALGSYDPTSHARCRQDWELPQKETTPNASNTTGGETCCDLRLGRGLSPRYIYIKRGPLPTRHETKLTLEKEARFVGGGWKG